MYSGADTGFFKGDLGQNSTPASKYLCFGEFAREAKIFLKKCYGGSGQFLFFHIKTTF